MPLVSGRSAGSFLAPIGRHEVEGCLRRTSLLGRLWRLAGRSLWFRPFRPPLSAVPALGDRRGPRGPRPVAHPKAAISASAAWRLTLAGPAGGGV